MATRPSIGLGRDIDLLVWANVCWGIGNGFHTYLLPLYVAQLGASPPEIGAVLALVNAVRIVIYVPGGLLADRFSRKAVMLVGWALAPGAMLVFWLARTWQQLIPAVILFAAVEICGPAYQSYIAGAVESRHLPRAFTWMFLGMTTGAAFSAPIGGWIAQAAGLRWLFAGAFAGYAASTVLVGLLGERPHAQPHPPARAQSSSVWRAWTAPRAPLAAAWNGARAAAWNAPMVRVLGLTAALYFAANLAQPLAPNWLVQRYGFATADVGDFGAVSAIGGAIFALAIGRLPGRRSAVVGVGLTILALELYVVLLLFASARAVAAGAYLLRGSFDLLPSLTVALLARAMIRGSTERLGLAFSLQKTARAAALTLSVVAAGWLYGAAPALPFLSSAISLAALFGAVAVFSARRRSTGMRLAPRVASINYSQQ